MLGLALTLRRIFPAYRQEHLSHFRNLADRNCAANVLPGRRSCSARRYAVVHQLCSLQSNNRPVSSHQRSQYPVRSAPCHPEITLFPQSSNACLHQAVPITIPPSGPTVLIHLTILLLAPKKLHRLALLHYHYKKNHSARRVSLVC